MLERDISAKAARHSAIAEHIGDMFEQRLKLGQRLADRVASVGGSWPRKGVERQPAHELFQTRMTAGTRQHLGAAALPVALALIREALAP